MKQRPARRAFKDQETGHAAVEHQQPLKIGPHGRQQRRKPLSSSSLAGVQASVVQ